MSRHLDGSGRRTSRPPMPNLHIVIGDKSPASGNNSELDSGYQSAVSAGVRDLRRASAAPDLSPSISELMPTPEHSMFANTDPFNPPRLPQDDRSAAILGSSIVEEPTTLIVPSIPARKNLKKLSLTSLDVRPTLRPTTSNMSMKSVAPNTVPMSLPPSPHLPHRKLSVQPAPSITVHEPTPSHRDPLPSRRRSSVMSLPPPTTYAKPTRTKYTTGRRAIEDDAETDAYADGPVEILPGVWLGAEDNASDWPSLAERSIGAVLNVAKEVMLPYENEDNTPYAWSDAVQDEASRGRLYAANVETGRPDMVYLHLPWSHGQNDLVHVGFVQAMSFIDRCLASEIGVLIHCQCGISRSATMAIAYVMRTAQSPSAESHVAKLKTEGMQGAYDFVKSKSQTIGPNMSLIYQLLEYERFLSPQPRGPGSDTSVDSAEAEWTRQRMAMDLQDHEEVLRSSSPDALSDGTTAIEAAEARELDQRMQARREQRSSSRASSLLSVTVSETQGVGAAGTTTGAWKSRFGNSLASYQGSSSSRARGLSIGSDISHASGKSSLVSGDSLVLEEEEDAEQSSDSPYSHSRKDSGDLDDVGDETFVQLPPVNRLPPTILLAPLPANARKRGSLASLRSTSALSQPSSGRSSPAFSRRSSELGAPPSARPDQLSFGSSQLAPPPSARPDHTSFSSQLGPPPSAAPTQTSFGFPSLPTRRRSNDTPSLGPPPVRSARLHTLSNSSRLGPLDTVPSSPIRSSEQETEGDDNTFIRKMEKKSKPAPLLIPAQPKPESIEIIASSSEGDSSRTHSSSASTSSLTSNMSDSSSRIAGSESRKMKGKDRVSRVRTSRPPQLNLVGSATPHQTLFIFPPSPQRYESILSPNGLRSSVPVPSTPSTMLLRTTQVASPTSMVPGADWRIGGHGASSSMSSTGSRASSRTTSISSIDTTGSTLSSSSRRKRLSALPSGITPTLAAFRRTFGTALPSTPTTATAHVDARGWVGSSSSTTGSARTASADLLGPLSPMTARPPRTGFGF